MIRLAALVLALFATGRARAADAPEGPGQPLPFSHKGHAGTLKLQCRMCHPNPDPGESMTIAGAGICMQCHSAIKTESPAVKKLAAHAKDNTPIPWVRIYEIPSNIDFSHRSHLNAHNTCEDCHGKVAERDRLYREVKMNMGTCIQCHTAKKASVECDYCHLQ